MPLDIAQYHISHLYVHQILSGSSGVYAIPSPQGYEHTVTTGYHPTYPRGTSVRIQVSLSPQDTGTDIYIRMLCFILFDSTSGLGLRNNFDPFIRFIAPRA